MRELLHCIGCGEVIGVYEPVILLADGRARETSRAAEPNLSAAPGKPFHAACYVRAQHGTEQPVA
jgi:hypothetical protein